MASPMLVEEESFEWDMGDNFGFYEDLEDNDDDDFGRGGGDSGYGYETCSSSTAVAIIPSSPATPSSPLSNNVDNIIHDIHPETLQTTPPILSSSLATKISEELPWSMQHEDMKWIRIFASSRDGCAFGSFMRNVRNVSHTVIVARTSSGKVVGGYATDVWSGRKAVAAPTTTTATSTSSSHAFLFVVEQPAAAAAATINSNVKTTPVAAAVESPSHSQQKRQAHQNYNKRFIPGLEEIASSPTSPLEFDFDLETLNAKKKSSLVPQEQEENNIIKVKSDEPQVHIFKPSPRKHPQQGGGHYYHSSSSLKQVCQLGNKFISLGDENDNDENHCLKLTIENSFSRGGITTTTSSTTTSSFKNKNGSGCISTTEEFDIVDFEVYYLSDD
jgi:hypothetical protein